jgi:hypothetical protein
MTRDEILKQLLNARCEDWPECTCAGKWRHWQQALPEWANVPATAEELDCALFDIFIMLHCVASQRRDKRAQSCCTSTPASDLDTASALGERAMTNARKGPSPELLAKLRRELLPAEPPVSRVSATERWNERQRELDAVARQRAIDAVWERTLKARAAAENKAAQCFHRCIDDEDFRG